MIHILMNFLLITLLTERERTDETSDNINEMKRADALTGDLETMITKQFVRRR